MSVATAMRRLWQHARFRRLFLIRVLTQAGDGTLQVGMASYILFSPQSQATAWDVAAVLALTLLPYTLIGPHISALLDHWHRRNIVVAADSTRAVLALLLAGLIGVGLTGGYWQLGLYAALLLALSISRFVLAGLSAALQHTVAADEYLTASAVVPTVGPIGVVLGALIGFAARVGLAPVLGVALANATVFLLAGLLFVGSAATAARFGRTELGPTQRAPLTSIGDVTRDLAAATRHLWRRRSAAAALTVMAATRVTFGMFSVAVIVGMRNTFHQPDQPEAAIGDLTLWGLLAGGGYILATVLVPLAVRLTNLRRTMIGALLLAGLTQLATAAWPSFWVLLGCTAVLGLAVQTVKIATDTVVQAQVAEHYKGRVFTLYDMAYNGGLVLAGVLAGLVLPAAGISPAVFLALTLGYVVAAAGFAWFSRTHDPASFERGTESL